MPYILDILSLSSFPPELWPGQSFALVSVSHGRSAPVLKECHYNQTKFWGATHNIQNVGHLGCSPTGLSSFPPELWPGQSFALVSVSHWFPIGLTDA